VTITIMRNNSFIWVLEHRHKSDYTDFIMKVKTLWITLKRI